MSDYETLRQGHLAYAIALAPRLIERLSWPADRLADHRAQRFARWCARPSTVRRGIAGGWQAWMSLALTR